MPRCARAPLTVRVVDPAASRSSEPSCCRVTPDAADSAALDRLGRALGRQYRVVRLVGRGGFAAVYEVVDTDLQRRLAVKVLRSDLPWTAATIARFKQEARASPG